MKTTLVIPDVLMNRLKSEAARRQTTMSQLVEEALRSLLDRERGPAELAALPTFDGGRPLVDVSNRDALYDAMAE